MPRPQCRGSIVQLSAPRATTRVEEHSPIRQQYLSVKRQHPGTIVFFRLGDFYEMFDEDAELVARELELTLTKRDWGRGERSPMAGVPHMAAESYIARLIAKGYRVAVCEQISDPALAKGLVEREVVRVVTPGTVVDPTMLAAKRNNYLAAAVLGRDAVGLAYADVTTGELACTQLSASEPEVALVQELARVQPAEVLVEATRPARPLRRGELVDLDEVGDRRLAANGRGAPTGDLLPDDELDLAARLVAQGERQETVITPYEARAFREDVARERLLAHFGVATLESFGCEHLSLAVRAAGAVIAYLRETQRDALAQFTAMETYSTSGFMVLDAHTRRNLELFESGRGGGIKGSLLWVLDATRTPMGGRLLRPLAERAAARPRTAARAPGRHRGGHGRCHAARAAVANANTRR
jgi:DNA mismatch repair protein MutS